MLDNKNEYMLIQNQKPMMVLNDEYDNVSLSSTMISHNTNNAATEKSLKRSSSLVDQSTSLCKRISCTIKRNFHDRRDNRREARREKRPQDGKTNPME
jgi:hypothetical protein